MANWKHSGRLEEMQTMPRSFGLNCKLEIVPVQRTIVTNSKNKFKREYDFSVASSYNVSFESF